MKVTGGKKLSKQLRELPDAVRADVEKAIRRNTEAGARMARQLVPIESGELKGWIFTKYDEQDGFRGSVEAAPPTKEAQIKARSVEFGRTKGDRGETSPAPYMRIMQKHMAKRFKASIKAAVNKAARRVTNG
jgi:hypothetical protein